MRRLFRFSVPSRTCLAMVALSTSLLASCGSDSQQPRLANATNQSQVEVDLEGHGPTKMNNQRLGELLRKHFPDHKVEGQLGLWRIALTDDEQDAESDQAKPDEDARAEDEREKKPNAEENGAPPDPEPAPLEEGPGADKHLPPVVVVMTDERANRMRIMMPIRPFDSQNVEDLQLALIALHANYDRALDARYAIQEGMLWSAFIHPLSSLTEEDLSSGLEQVITLRKNTGTSYSSGAFIFAPQGGGEGPAQEAPAESDTPGDNVT